MFVTMDENSRHTQYVAALAATLSMTSAACFFTWPSPTLPLLQSEDSPIGTAITDEEGSWVVSSLVLVSLPFIFVSGWLFDRFGRRTTLLMAAFPLSVPWLIIIFARDYVVLCVARSIAGFGIAIATVGCPMYVCEIADVDIRGRLATFFIVMKMSGNIIVLSVGPFVSYTTLASLCLAFPLIFFATFFFMPESPYYLVKAGRRDDARRMLVKLAPRCCDKEAVESRLKEIEVIVEKDMASRTDFKEVFVNRENLYALLIMLGVKSLQQFNGQTPIEPYMQTIVKSSGSSITPEISSIIFGAVQLVSVMLAGVFVDKCGRRPLLLASAVGCALALTAEGAYFYLQDVVHADLDAASWLPTTALIVFLFMNYIGMGTLPYVLIGELFATNIKEHATSLVTFYAGSLAFLWSKFFQPLSNDIGMYSTFWIFAGCCVLGSFFVYFALPETKGKTFADIQAGLRGKKNAHAVV